MVRRFVIVVLFLISVPLSCTDLGTEPSVSGIVWNWSIDRVRLGDDSATVIRKLGRPNSTYIGDFPGYGFEYATGPHAGLDVTFWTKATSSCPRGVTDISVRAPYTGTTKQGVGLGSTREEMRGVFGSPTYYVNIFDAYVNGSSITFVRYESNKVRSMTLACF